MSTEIGEQLADALPEFEVAPAATSTGPWLITDADLAPPFRLLRIGERPCLWHPERVVQIADDLDVAQELLDRIEGVSGWRFEPADLITAEHSQIVRIEAPAIALELALDKVTAAPATLSATAAATPRRGDRPRPTTLSVIGPSFPVEVAAALEPGDLLLLPSPAQVRVAGDAFMLDLTTGALSATSWSMEPDARTAFEVRLEITLAPVAIVPDALAAIPSGQPLQLGPLPRGMPVEVAIAGRAVAAGVLVRLGDAVAVRLETLIAALEAAA